MAPCQLLALLDHCFGGPSLSELRMVNSFATSFSPIATVSYRAG